MKLRDFQDSRVVFHLEQINKETNAILNLLRQDAPDNFKRSVNYMCHRHLADIKRNIKDIYAVQRKIAKKQ